MTSCARNCARESWISAWWKWKCASDPCPEFEIVTNQGVEEMDINVKDMLSGLFGQQKKKRKMTVSEAFDYLIQEEENK